MCLAIIARRYMPLDLMVEHVFLTTEDGNLNTKEVYDVVLTPDQDWEDASLFCVSPHDLFDYDGSLRVESYTIPGAGGHEDIFYQESLQCSADYHAASGIVTITVLEAHDSKTVMPKTFSAKGIQPTVRQPLAMGNDERVVELMGECGTLFEVCLGSLTVGVSYAFRLIVKPYKLLGLPERRALSDPRLDPWQAEWVQDATIVGGNTVLFDYQNLMAENRQSDDYANAAATIQTIIEDDDVVLLPVKLHQIILVLERGSELIRKGKEGCAWEISWNTLPGGHLAAVWGGGTSQYWIDDPESVAQRIYDHFKAWGVADAKSKEDVSTALEASHENCSLIIDALCKLGFIRWVGGGKYRPADAPPPGWDGTFRRLAQLKAIRKGFGWQGYRISYAVQYTHLTEEQERRLKRYRLREKATFWLSIVAITIAIAGLVIGLLALF